MTLLAPVRFDRLPLTPVDEGLDPHDRHPGYDIHTPPPPPLRQHDYLHSLILAAGKGSWVGRQQGGSAFKETAALGIDIPATVAAPRTVLSRRRYTRHQRSLSEPFLEARRMAVVVEEKDDMSELPNAPSSPPDLSYSKSSKSSSSSEDSDCSDEKDGDTSTDKLEQFDDASVDGRDSIDDSNLRPESRPTLRRPPPRSATMGEMGRRVLSPPVRLHENKYPSLRGAVNGVLRDQSLNLPHGRGMRRGFTSPASPSYLMQGGQRVPSRSPSPTKPIVYNGTAFSTQMMASQSTPRLSTEPRSPNTSTNPPFGRRKSWQPGRKSVKQLEAEYDDFDEEVPDGAILENVPISPMPGQSRLSPRTSRSTTPSPNRRGSHVSLHSAPSHTSLHSANVPKNAKRPSAPTILPNGQYGSPRSPRYPRPPMLQHSMTLPAFSGDHMNRRQRSKSWTEDLNDEARALSAALEEHAERASMERHGSGTNSVSNSPPRATFAKQRAKTQIMDMPPISYGSIMIDPLPISKEKEAVLSKTRPSWLPPKDQKEERKHLREWEAMMARAAENERRRQLKQREAEEDSEELKDSLARIWDQHVLPNWATVIDEPRTRELWWRGVTPASRGVVWQKAIGNELELNESAFESALHHATELEDQIAQMSPEDREKSPEAAWFAAIARDIPPACPTELAASEKRAPFQNALRDVLKAYTVYLAPTIGYVYGVHLPAALLCAHLRPVDAFVTLANLLHRPLPRAFLTHDAEGMQRAQDLVLATLEYKFPALHAHLSSPALELTAGDILDPMFRCLFAHHLSPECVRRVWDVYVFEGDKALVRTAVAVLGKLEGKLLGKGREEVLQLVGWREGDGAEGGVLDLGSEEEFMILVREAGKVDAKGGEEIKPVYV